MNPAANAWAIYTLIGLSLVLGVMAVIPIGGADMPVVISLLNSYSGLAACAAGFVVMNNLLIVAARVVGRERHHPDQHYVQGMNRSLANVLFSGFGSVTQSSGGAEQQGEVKPIMCRTPT